MIKKLIFAMLGLIFLFSGVACSSSQTNTSQSDTSQAQQSTPVAPQTPAPTPPTEPDKGKKNPVVTIEMNDGKKIKFELYPKVTPNTVNNFISLVKKGAYDNTIFHRVMPDFMIQGGDPEGTGQGGPGYSIKGEFAANGFQNNLSHQRGVVSMARADSFDSAGSQFFIMVADNPGLDGNYAAFGKVLEGMDEVDKIVNVPRDTNQGRTENRPIDEQKMKKVTVETFGIQYPEPEKVSP